MRSNKTLVTSTPNIQLDQGTILAQGDIDITNSSSTKVFNTLVDVSTWPKWNRWVPYCTIRYQPTTTSTCTTSDSVGDGDEPSPILQLGTKFSMHVNMSMTSTTTVADSLSLHEQGKLTSLHLIVTLFEAPDPLTHKAGRIAWTIDHDEMRIVPKWLLKLERMHVVSEKEGTEEEGGKVINVTTWEIMASSWAASIMGWFLRNTFEDVNFPAWLGGLKEYAES
ncbi:hypothetical protein TMatcc_000140 [Talaromyces marneffei ATCC 18224]|uniref:Polyketide cyclase/dehydrase n=1 Tax=Talaromyces marneffei (strain ATCC 18224 / CBS 334.59 / QM 7333) TaxID=441960 RepID=B6QPV9_TALMQ|nr:uncharacterized protein EYB26_005227 [Talaromyces marneffei]EEA20165.1 conserved hypothetical protein [Talaromyces marneffei ATCC 18224]KAE8549178.1 hypothetical protein EYB25_007693 [Talaromyces marneffei]QGA17556.1 hypothetical protein EYB26_005227 [Talaromyces marneffei]